MIKPTFHIAGDQAFILRFGQEIHPEVHKHVISYYHAILAMDLKGVTLILPTYCEITIHYDPLVINHNTLLKHLKAIDLKNLDDTDSVAKLIHIPVLYGGLNGPDLEIVARQNKLSTTEVINKHTEPKYLVYMLGFTPGFVYLGGLNKQISTPRKAIPRPLIKEGSVGIAGSQTGIYPIDSPGGWQIIGETPFKLFDVNRQPEVLINAGDYIQFNAINESTFNSIKTEVDSGNYNIEVETILLSHE
ncbi:5-oxoprolinase subunit PxpB [Carboxylicivirga sp. N1Y90]|uniref:5-oxoprolinase subunit PxpB n=1 Tax=Carboxylicivirga fragile TaxID=3417571 RepID=UPI003D34B0F2|nr:5-oxoprolinase subunit PxpB [Marinilabiliaceae bacterium N1Y90]